ncbi:MAG: serine hydrolase [Dehalococcoidales bacterium]|nr:MAG: serine hydrolase [Dehalococcoidales bacterium]
MKICQSSAGLIVSGICILTASIVGCSPSAEYLEDIEYEPVLRDDWGVSTPEAEGIDPDLMAETYYNASRMDTIYGLLVIKNGKLIGEKYFNAGSIDQLSKRASVTKSYVSAMVGIALDRGYLTSLDQKMLDFFPDIVDQVTDPRKKQITIRNMLEMKAGYPWEEEDGAAWAALWSGEYLSHIAGIPLFTDSGTRFKYSNLTSHWLGIIVARASGMDLMSFGTQYLFSPLGVEPGEDWNRDVDGYYVGSGDILFTARDMAKFGLLYLDEGRYQNSQLIPESWVQDSLKTYSEKAWGNIGLFHDIGYGYQWWLAKAGEYHVNFAWGHGGQLIVLVDELDLLVVTTADSFYGEDVHFNSWKYEKAIIELVADFVHSIPVSH